MAQKLWQCHKLIIKTGISWKHEIPKFWLSHICQGFASKSFKFGDKSTIKKEMRCLWFSNHNWSSFTSPKQSSGDTQRFWSLTTILDFYPCLLNIFSLAYPWHYITLHSKKFSQNQSKYCIWYFYLHSFIMYTCFWHDRSSKVLWDNNGA